MASFPPPRPFAKMFFGITAIFVVVVGSAFSSLPRALGQSAAARLPVPSKAAQAVAQAALKREFLQIFRALNSETGMAFADRLARKYKVGEHDPVRRFVALTLAWHLYAQYGDWVAPQGPISTLGRFFLVDKWSLNLAASRQLYPELAARHDRYGIKMTGKNTLVWARQALAAGDYKPVLGLLRLSERCLRQVGDKFNLGRAQRLARRVAPILPALRQRAVDKKLLRASPLNSAALLRTALYYWLIDRKPGAGAVGNSEAKKSSCVSLAKIMKLAAQEPRDAHGLIRLGNLWWELAKTHKLLAYTPLVQQHAIEIYRRAIPGVAQAFSAMVGNGDYHAAVLFIGHAKKAAARTRDPKILATAHQWNRMLRQARILHRRYTAALKTISKKADDPAANQTIGEYLCFLGGQWKSGLAYLKLSGLPGLRSAAEMDLANPQTPAAQIGLGNKWWILARGYRGIMKTNIQLRAVHWYALALKKLPAGADKDLRYRVAKLQASNP